MDVRCKQRFNVLKHNAEEIKEQRGQIVDFKKQLIIESMAKNYQKKLDVKK